MCDVHSICFYHNVIFFQGSGESKGLSSGTAGGGDQFQLQKVVKWWSS